MLPARAVYNRIRWDRGLEVQWFTIGYEDRTAGIVEASLSAFCIGDVPWHRVQYFRCGEQRVWDRQARLDIVDTLRREPAQAEPQADARRFSSRASFASHMAAGRPAWVACRLRAEYPSFVEEAVLHPAQPSLAVEWRSYAMDWMGDATCVSVVYGFDDLDALLAYVRDTCGTDVTDWWPSAPPLPPGTPYVQGYPRSLVATYQRAWQALRADFANDLLIDRSQRLVRRFDGVG